MRQGQQNRRSRGRGRKQQNPLSRNYESNGPDVKIRGTASHVAEKYSSLARDALAAGDMVTAENYFQHAEHYTRIILAAQVQSQSNSGQSRDGDSANANGAGEGRQDNEEAVAEAQGDAAVADAEMADGDARQASQGGDGSGNRRGGRRRANGNGRARSGNGDGRRNSNRASSDAEEAPGEFAGLPPSVSTSRSLQKPDGAAAEAASGDSDAAESVGDDSAIAS